MGRLHLFELEDQPWFPRVLRDAGTAYLHFVATKTGQPRSLAPKVAEVLENSRSTHIVDLCSGGAGPVPGIVEELARGGRDVDATLTDLFPNERSLDAASSTRIRFEREPVDATKVPRRLEGLRTIFNGFHHFRPELARRVLADAVDAKQPIAIFEVVARKPAALLGMLFAPLAVLFVVPFLRPFRWSWIPLTYLVPIIPLFVMWDGFVSCLRVYSPSELKALVADVKSDGWTWDCGELPIKGAPVPATWLVGRPKAEQ